MSRRKTSQDFVQGLKGRGYSDAAIGRATGRSADYIRLVRTGKRPADNLRESFKTLSRRAPRKPGGALPKVATPAARPGRKQEKFKTPSGTLYKGAYEGESFYMRLLRAATNGKKVSIRAKWELVAYFDTASGKRKPRKPDHHKTISIYGSHPVSAEQALEDLDAHGFDPGDDDGGEMALASLTVQRNPQYEELTGLEEIQLLIEDEGGDW